MGEVVVFDWLFEGRLTVYLLLATAGVLFAGLWWRDREPNWLMGAGAALLLIVVYFLLDRLVETGREQIPNNLQAMARGVKERRADDVLAHVSERFELEGLDKKAFAEAVREALKQRVVDDLYLTAIEFEKWPPDEGQPARVSFNTTAKNVRAYGGQGDALVRCEAEFVRDPDGRWRMKGLKVFSPPNADTPMSLRGYLR
jgi:hypothetical protein